MPADNREKGGYAEELARLYFNRTGHFVIRGAEQRYGGYSVTDIDLWAYSKGGANRNITLVDIKNKQRPEAFDRILWLSGLRNANKAHDAVVITTDKRKEVVDFAKKIDIEIITISKLRDWYAESNILDDYIDENDFSAMIKQYRYYKTDGDWKEKYESLKTTMVSEIGFASAIICLDYAKFFAQKAIEVGVQDSLPSRLFLRSVAYFCISIDFVISKKLVLNRVDLEKELRIGLSFGPSGQDGLEDQLTTLRGLLIGYDDEGLRIFNSVRKNLYSSLENDRLKIITELLSKPSVYNQLFRLGQVFDVSCRSIKMNARTEVVDAIALLFMLADYWNIERKKIKFLTDIFHPLSHDIQSEAPQTDN